MFKKGCASLNKGKHNGRPRTKEYSSKEYGKKIKIKCCICGIIMERYISQLINHHHSANDTNFYCLECYRKQFIKQKLNAEYIDLDIQHTVKKGLGKQCPKCKRILKYRGKYECDNCEMQYDLIDGYLVEAK